MVLLQRAHLRERLSNEVEAIGKIISVNIRICIRFIVPPGAAGIAHPKGVGIARKWRCCYYSKIYYDLVRMARKQGIGHWALGIRKSRSGESINT